MGKRKLRLSVSKNFERKKYSSKLLIVKIPIQYYFSTAIMAPKDKHDRDDEQLPPATDLKVNVPIKFF